MKRVLGILAAGILAVTPLYAAFAQDTWAAEEAVQEAPADESASSETAATAEEEVAIPVREFMMEGDVKFYVEGDAAYTLDEKGEKVPLADGEHKLADGTVFDVVEGLASGLPAAEAPAAEASESEAAADGEATTP
jgi:hypothetical protein